MCSERYRFLGEKMGHLNQQQKAILKEWFKNHGKDAKIGFNCTTDLPDDVYWKVHDLNDFETLNQEIESFINDLISEALNQ